MVDAPLADGIDRAADTREPGEAAEFLIRLQRQVETLFGQIVAPADGRLERFDNLGGWGRFALDGADNQRILHIRQLLLTLELHCKVEEQFLIPDLQGGNHLQAAALDSEWSALRTLRDLADKVRAASQSPSIQLQWLLALEGVAMLHFDTVQRHLQQNTAPLRRRHLGADMQNMLRRWQRELRTTGAPDDEPDAIRPPLH